jgi:hypothetical protein
MAKLYRVQLAVHFTTQDNVAQKCEYSVAAAGHCGRYIACGIWGSLNEAVGCRGRGVSSVSENGEWWEHGSGKRRKLRENVVPLPLHRPQIPHQLAKNLIRSFAVKSQRLTSLTVAFS